MATTEITNSTDIIDSRDVIARIADLESDHDTLDQDELNELKALSELEEEADGYAVDWMHGEALIRDSYFEDYARQLAEDIGAIPSDIGWPCSCIDWKKATSELQMDYTSVSFDGVEYWIR